MKALELFYEVNRLVYGTCAGPVLEDFVERKREEICSKQNEESKRKAVLDYINLIGLELFGDNGFKDRVLLSIQAQYN